MRFYHLLLACLTLFLCLSLCSYCQPRKTVNTRLDEMLHSFFGKNDIGCAILVAQKGKIIYQKAVGKSDIELDVPLSLQSVFRIGSVTKQFTAVAILQLVEKGFLRLEDSLHTYISDFTPEAKKVTIENLLTHTSGIKNITDLTNTETTISPCKPADLIRMFKDLPLNFQPGEKFEYSNSNYILLGYIIEQVSGLTYEAYLQLHFFDKLGMLHSYYDSPSNIVKDRAKGYDLDTSFRIVNAAYLNTTFPYAAGGLIMSVSDYFIWHQALWSYKLIRQDTFERALAGYLLNDSTTTNYGYGWFFRNLYGSETVGHGGSINGFQSREIYLPKEDILVAVFSNGSFINTTKISDEAAAIASDKEQMRIQKLNAAIAKTYVGTYQFTPDDPTTLTIFKSDGNYYLKVSDAPSAWQIHFIKKNEFICYEAFPNTHILHCNAEGKVDYLILKNFDFESKAAKVK